MSVKFAADLADLPLRAGEHVDLAELYENLGELRLEEASIVGELVDDPTCGPVAVEVLVNGEDTAAELQVLVVVVVHLQGTPLVVQEHGVPVRRRHVRAHPLLVHRRGGPVHAGVRRAGPAAVPVQPAVLDRAAVRGAHRVRAQQHHRLVRGHPQPGVVPDGLRRRVLRRREVDVGGPGLPAVPPPGAHRVRQPAGERHRVPGGEDLDVGARDHAGAPLLQLRLDGRDEVVALDAQVRRRRLLRAGAVDQEAAVAPLQLQSLCHVNPRPLRNSRRYTHVVCME
jgi:hypothetical protein